MSNATYYCIPAKIVPSFSFENLWKYSDPTIFHKKRAVLFVTFSLLHTCVKAKKAPLVQFYKTYRQSNSKAESFCPATEIIWSIIPHGIPTNLCSAAWQIRARLASLQRGHREIHSPHTGIQDERKQDIKIKVKGEILTKFYNI